MLCGKGDVTRENALETPVRYHWRSPSPHPPFHWDGGRMCMKHKNIRASILHKSLDGVSENFQPPFIIENGCGPIAPVQ
jgi:hypothetical protein